MHFLFRFLFLCSLTGVAHAAEGPQEHPAKNPPAPACSSPKWGEVVCIRPNHYAQDTCAAIEVFANRHGLNVGFFARLIWQESRFDPHAISHAGAQGIAQFMPFTARRRGLRDAFNPAEALDHSSEYLADMAARFGNLGLAAIGYNGGEHRVEALVQDGARLPRETRDYVKIITGIGHTKWAVKDVRAPDLRLSKTEAFQSACIRMAANRRISPPPRLRAKTVPFDIAETAAATIKTAAILSPFAPQISPFPKTRPKHLRAPWGVQLAFGTSNKDALRKFQIATKQCRKRINGEIPDLIPVKNRISKRKGFVMARIGRQSLQDARRLCQKLAAAGCPCRVFKNTP